MLQQRFLALGIYKENAFYEVPWDMGGEKGTTTCIWSKEVTNYLRGAESFLTTQ
jgi:hypothetical protein